MKTVDMETRAFKYQRTAAPQVSPYGVKSNVKVLPGTDPDHQDSQAGKQAAEPGEGQKPGSCHNNNKAPKAQIHYLQENKPPHERNGLQITDVPPWKNSVYLLKTCSDRTSRK